MIKYKISYEILGEIRMDSAFNAAKIKLEGEFIPKMDEYTFQDVSLISDDGLTCYLVQWETSKNAPGHII